jgi:hypothetical protein
MRKMREHMQMQLGELAADDITGKRAGVAARETLQVRLMHVGSQTQG